jgi:hypothetical protein
MPKDKVKGLGPEGRLAKSATRTPVRAIETALSLGFGGAMLPWPPQIRLASREPQRPPTKSAEKKGRR